MDKILALCAMILTVCANDGVTEWEHGYKTDYVVATRYSNPMMGYNIGFELPKNPYDADRAEMFEWLEKNGVHIFEGGGGPGAILYAKVEGVTDKESANRFLVEFLPKFNKWARKNLH
jgi:hypothetical protein